MASPLKQSLCRETPLKLTSVEGSEYRPGKTGFCQRVVDKYKKWYYGHNLTDRSRYGTKRRKMPPLDFRRILHNNVKEVTAIPMAKEHSHGQAASLRTSVASRLDNLILEAGYTPYSVSMSERDKYDGCRYMFMDKDLDKEFRDDPITERHVIMIIDSDYYLDINAYLCYGNPVLLYTFVPTDAVGAALNARYTIVDNVVEYAVEGGATYKHELWDYRGDTVSVRDRYGNLLIYKMEQYIMSADLTRRIIGFYPIAYYPRNTCVVKNLGTGIKRLKCCTGGVVCIKNTSKATVSVAVEGSSTAVTVAQEVFDALVIRRGSSKNPVISDVERILNHAGIADAAMKAPILFKLLQEPMKCGHVMDTSVVPVHNFQTLTPLVMEDGRPVGRAVAPSLVTSPAVIPNKSYNNDVATVEGRIKKVTNNKRTPFAWSKYDDELIKYIVPLPGVGTPLDAEQVIEIQDRPAQRGRSAQIQPVLCVDNVNRVKAFIKAEAYGSVTDPRNISTVDPGHQINYSRYTYAFKQDCLQGRPWFASCMDPTTVTGRVHAVAQHPDGVIMSDYSRLDGHISGDDKAFKEKVYMHWCHPSHRQNLSNILHQDKLVRGSTANGIRYNTGTTQLSGSPGTTNDNNLVTLRHDYIALRELGMTATKAQEFLETWVLGASDDRMRANIPGYSGMLESVANKLGHKLKSDVFYPLKDDCITFLGRIYAPSFGLDSIQCPIRTLPKLHLTTSPADVPDDVALLNRARGYYATDAKTPILGPWCKKVIDILTGQGVISKMLTKSERQRIDNGPYPQDNVDVLRDLMCRLLELTADDLDGIEVMINNTTAISELPEFIIDNSGNISHRIPAAVGHDLVGPVPAESTTRDFIESTSSPEITECPSVATTSATCAHPEIPGSSGSNPILGNPSQPPTTVVPTMVRTAVTSDRVMRPRSMGMSNKSLSHTSEGGQRKQQHQAETQQRRRKPNRPNPRQRQSHRTARQQQAALPTPQPSSRQSNSIQPLTYTNRRNNNATQTTSSAR